VSVIIGHGIYSKKPIYYPVRINNCTLIVAESRSGKTIQAINIAAQLSRQKKLLIFDYGAEDWKHLGYMNFTNDYMRLRVERYQILHVDKIKFHISDFYKQSHWETFGITSLSARILSKLARRVDVHKNTVKLFMKMINELPTDRFSLISFNKRYGDGEDVVDTPFTMSTIGALKQRMYAVFENTNFFVDAHLPNFTHKELYKLLDQGHLCIDLDLAKAGSDVFWAKIIVGKILEELTTDFKKLAQYHLFIVMEEADKLVPEVAAGETVDICLGKTREFVRKHRRHNIEMVFITQDFIKIDSEISMNCPTKILGNVAPQRNPYYIFTQNLRFIPEKNYREFLLIDENQRKEIYNPLPSPTAYGRYDHDNLRQGGR